jgi:HEAT repeat protein
MMIRQDPVLIAALWVTGAAILVCAGLALAILGVRSRQETADTHRRRFAQTWRPLLAQCLAEPPQSLPPLAPEDVPAFCELWNHLHGSLRGSAADNLNAAAKLIDLDQAAAHLLRSPRFADRMLACVTLGYLRQPAAWPILSQLVPSGDSMLSLIAVHALMRIDPRKATDLFLPVMGSRKDWPVANLIVILQEAGANIVTEPLCEACRTSPPAIAARLALLLPAAHHAEAEATVQAILSEATDTEMIASSLRALRSPASRDLARAFLEHPAWQVRLQAVRALGRLATEADAPVLIQRLTDTSWWVRYRAAEALAAIPAFDLYKWENAAGVSVKSDLRGALLQAIRDRDARPGTAGTP